MTYLPTALQKDEDMVPAVTIHVGGVHVSRMPVKVITVLGSCVSACLYDPSTRTGGMNHFLLPGDPDGSDYSTRYGINAMEILINEMMKAGADRLRLQAKVFGGADIFRSNHDLMMVGRRNTKFIHEFLETEKIPVISERLGGDDGLVVHYFTHTFEVFVKPISTDRYKWQQEEESRFYRSIQNGLKNRSLKNVTLF